MEEFELTFVLFGTEDGALITGPALLRDGQLWLVAKWSEAHGGPPWRPAIAIRLPMVAVQQTTTGPAPYLLNGSVPKAALHGETSEGLGLVFEVVAEPAWQVAPPLLH